MSANNYFLTRKKAHDLNEVTVAAAYTVKIGRASDGFKFDCVVNVTEPAANMTVTVPDSGYEGQLLLINLTSNDDSKTVTIADTTGGLESTMATAGQYQLSMWVNSTSGWVVLKESVTS